MSMDRAELRDAARKAFGESGLVPDAPTSWSTLSDMGWFMMSVPEDQGGLGLGREAAGAIHTELGRALVPGPAIAHMLVVEALAATGQTELLALAMAGSLMTTNLCHAPDADSASHVLMVTPGQIAIAPIASAAHRATWDETRRLFDVVPGPAQTLAEGAAADALGAQLQSSLLFALAADSLGAADAALLMTIDYLKTRRQFDRPLALFQSLKHRVADMKLALAAADALFWSRAGGAVTLAQMGALKAHATTAAIHIAEEAVQLHGGIGLTQEHPCHVFLKRIFLNAGLGGDADHWNELAGRAALETVAD